MQKIKGLPHLSTAKIFKKNTKHKIKIEIEAYWPTPNWEHVSTHIDVNEANKNITITYLGQKKEGMSVMMIKEFTFELNLSFPNFGKWVILIKGRSKDITKSFEVCNS